MRILIAEDDTLLADGLRRSLAGAGYTVDLVGTGGQADRAALAEPYDLVVLDIGLPEIDGFEVLRRIRKRSEQTKILVLTARDAVEDRVHGLDLGADDYLTKPFSVSEFEARVRALLRRAGASATEIIVLKGLEIDQAAKRVRVNGAEVDLTAREWGLLDLFLARPGRVLSKDQIVQGLFSFNDQVAPNTIEVYVSRLRGKIEPAGVSIRTVRGFGYLWEAGER